MVLHEKGSVSLSTCVDFNSGNSLHTAAEDESTEHGLNYRMLPRNQKTYSMDISIITSKQLLLSPFGYSR